LVGPPPACASSIRNTITWIDHLSRPQPADPTAPHRTAREEKQTRSRLVVVVGDHIWISIPSLTHSLPRLLHSALNPNPRCGPCPAVDGDPCKLTSPPGPCHRRTRHRPQMRADAWTLPSTSRVASARMHATPTHRS
jgi:hypothetical protein